MPSSFSSRVFQTPQRGSPGWRPSFSDYSHIQGHAHVVYSSDHQSATVEIKTITKSGNRAKLTYFFDDIPQSNPKKEFNSQNKKTPLKLKVVDENFGGKILNLEEIDFMWNTHTKINLPDNYKNGQKGSIIELFGWKDEEIEKECLLISKAGYLGVRLFPHQEQLMSVQPMKNVLNPWYFMYQPVSYKLQVLNLNFKKKF
jgi:alpha-amylase